MKMGHWRQSAQMTSGRACRRAGAGASGQRGATVGKARLAIRVAALGEPVEALRSGATWRRVEAAAASRVQQMAPMQEAQHPALVEQQQPSTSAPPGSSHGNGQPNGANGAPPSGSAAAWPRRDAESVAARRAQLLGRASEAGARFASAYPRRDRAGGEGGSGAAADRMREALEARVRDEGREGADGGTGSARGRLQRSGRLEPSAWRDKKQRMILTKLRLAHHVDFGKSLRIVGSDEKLGSWKSDEGLMMSWSEGDVWCADILLPVGKIYEYKYAVVLSDGTKVAEWQAGNNNVLAIAPDLSEDMEVKDSWDGDPGSATVTIGTVTMTKEECLVKWADQFTESMTVQRSELRQLNMQLHQAREVASGFAAENKQLRHELAEHRKATAEVERRQRRLEAENKGLRRELQAIRVEFSQVMQSVQELLEDYAIDTDNDVATS